MEPHLLIIDDDARIRELLQKYLRKHGFLVSGARDAAHARRILAGLDFDLMICDVMMPGEDGVSFVADFRRENTMPVLMLTAKGSTEDRIAGLEAGADDYLSKPFDPKELLLRVNAILRRTPEPIAQSTAPKPFLLVPFTMMWGAPSFGKAMRRLSSPRPRCSSCASFQPRSAKRSRAVNWWKSLAAIGDKLKSAQ
jgi:two-component system phosphate regulon response regulator OmpR